MGKIMKQGRVVILLSGRFAGRKGVVVKSYDDGTAERPYGHALVAGINKYPLKVTKRMGKKKVAKRIKIKPFVKVVSLQHLLPTRCMFDADFDKSVVNKESIKEPVKKKTALSTVKKEFETRYKTEKSRWLFTKLLLTKRMCRKKMSGAFILAGLALAAAGYTGHYLLRNRQLITKAVGSLPLGDTSMFSKYYFDAKMSRREASLILGVSYNAKPAKVKEAHKQMIVNHPDRGGSPYLAAKINEAKDLLETREG